MEEVNPSMTVSRLDLGGSGLCGGWINISSTPLGFLEYCGIYRAKRRFRGHPRWAAPTWARPGGCCSPRATPGASLAHLMSSGPKISSRSFVAFGLHLILISCDVKNILKTTIGTGHYFNRLVPKNDIK